jgi:hypothetical protein
MKQHLLSALALGLATAGLAACASDYSYGYGGGYGYSRYAYYDGYYDDYYGPVSYGYWGPDNYFYYSTTVSREAVSGAHRFHMRGQLRAENRRDRDHDRKG